MLKKATDLILLPAIGGLIAALILLFFFKQPTAHIPEINTSQQPPFEGVSSYANAVERASPSVVNIYTVRFTQQKRRTLFGFIQQQQQQPVRSLGSGVIVSPQGYILTNHHVVNGADQIQVLLKDGRDAIATLVGGDAETDLAVLKIDLPDLQTIEFGNPQQARVGDVVLAIGNPYGFGHSVSQGIVSATHRYSENIRVYEGYLQTDAAINPGNSGGALVDSNGRLLGINTFILSKSGGSQGIGLAVPIDLARQALQDIIQEGRVLHGWLGINVQQVHPRIARYLNLKTTQGVVITQVAPKSPAAKGGLQPGDLITHINGEILDNSLGGGIQFASLRPGEKAMFTFLRESKDSKTKEMKATVVIGVRPVK